MHTGFCFPVGDMEVFPTWLSALCSGGYLPPSLWQPLLTVQPPLPAGTFCAVPRLLLMCPALGLQWPHSRESTWGALASWAPKAQWPKPVGGARLWPRLCAYRLYFVGWGARGWAGRLGGFPWCSQHTTSPHPTDSTRPRAPLADPQAPQPGGQRRAGQGRAALPGSSSPSRRQERSKGKGRKGREGQSSEARLPSPVLPAAAEGRSGAASSAAQPPGVRCGAGQGWASRCSSSCFPSSSSSLPELPGTGEGRRNRAGGQGRPGSEREVSEWVRGWGWGWDTDTDTDTGRGTGRGTGRHTRGQRAGCCPYPSRHFLTGPGPPWCRFIPSPLLAAAAVPPAPQPPRGAASPGGFSPRRALSCPHTLTPWHPPLFPCSVWPGGCKGCSLGRAALQIPWAEAPRGCPGASPAAPRLVWGSAGVRRALAAWWF